MRFVSLVNSVLGKTRRAPEQAASINQVNDAQKDQATSPADMAKTLRQMMLRINKLEAAVVPEPTEFEVVVGINGALTELYHGLKGPVRWWVTLWQQADGAPEPTKAPVLIRDQSSTNNSLFLQSYVAGRAVIRVEQSKYDLDPGVYVAGIPTLGADSAMVSGLRLTAITATPIADAAGATSIFLTPYLSGQIMMFFGGEWQTRNTPEVSVAVPATTATNYDVYAFWTGTAVALELLAWTNATTRATALSRQSGILIKSGDSTRLYLGTVRTGAISGQVPDTAKARFVWNQYNRVHRPLSSPSPSGSWTYVAPNGLWRQSNLLTSNSFEYVTGDVSHIVVRALSHGQTNGALQTFAAGIGFDSINVNSAQLFGNWCSSTQLDAAHAHFTGYAALGYHLVNWLETGQGALTHTFFGSGAGGPNLGGIQGELLG